MPIIRLITWLFAALLAVACESAAELELDDDNDTAVMTSFVHADSAISVSVYGSARYTDTLDYAVLDGVEVTLNIAGREAQRQTIADGQITARFDGATAAAGDEISIVATTQGKTLTATTQLPEAVEIIRIDTATTADKELYVMLHFVDKAETADYYQVKAYRRVTSAEGVTTTTTLDCDYSDFLFYVAQGLLLQPDNDNSIGLFNDGNINGEPYGISFSIAWSDILADVPDGAAVNVVLTLFHHTYDYYTLLISTSNSLDYLLLPIFGQQALHTNVSGGYGIVTGIAQSSTEIEIIK